MVDILTNNKLYANDPAGELAAGGVIWATNVIAFALWYWDLDRGGAAAGTPPRPRPGVLLPEMQLTDYVPTSWVPRFLDYLSLSFWTSTAFRSYRDVSDQAMGQGPHDGRSGSVACLGRAGDLPGDQHPLASGTFA